MECIEKYFKIAADGYYLAASKHIPEKGRPVIVFFHGFTGHRIETGRLYVDLARTLCNSGFVCVRFDYRGHGESPFSFEEFSLDWAFEDAESTVEYILNNMRNEVDVSRLGIIGFSLGGAVAIHIASKYPQLVKTMALLAPALSFRRIRDRLKTGIFQVKDGFAYFGAFRMRLENMLKMSEFDGLSLARRIKAPTLIVHCRDDNTIPYELSTEFYEKLAGEKKLILYNEGGHTFSNWHLRRTLEGKLVKWFKDTLI